MITVRELTKIYPGGIRALDAVTLDINGGMFGLVGPNGAGKTTLMRILAGLMRPSAGEVRVLGFDVTSGMGKQAVKAGLGYLPQEMGVYPDLTGREFLDYIAVLKGVTDAHSRRAQVEDVLGLVGLAEVAGRRLKTYSGGMKRRVGIAQALLGSPQLLIVDEPTSGLDPEERVRFRNLLAEMARRCTVILSTHIIEDIGQSCTDLAVLDHGRVRFHGAPLALMEQVRGSAWQLVTSQPLPEGRWVVVSTLQTAQGTQYRLLGERPDGLNPQPVEPTLEDGYLWLMRGKEAISF